MNQERLARIVEKIKELLLSQMFSRDITTLFCCYALGYNKMIANNEYEEITPSHIPVFTDDVSGNKFCPEGCLINESFEDFLDKCNIEHNWILENLAHSMGFESILELKFDNKTIYMPIVGLPDGEGDYNYYAVFDIRSSNLNDITEGIWKKNFFYLELTQIY